MTSGPLIYTPNYFTQKGIVAFLFVVAACCLLFIDKTLPILWICFQIAEVFFFFFFLNVLTRNWRAISVKDFEKKLLRTSFYIRIVWVVFSYLFYTNLTGEPFEFSAGDSKGYHGEALWLLGLLKDDKWNQYMAYIGKNYSDMGYPFYLGMLYSVFGDSVLVPRLIKALLGALTCRFTYRLARANFGESVGRVAGIMAMLAPNLIYYCGLHLKETEMLFLTIGFVYFGDRVIRSQRLTLSALFWLVVLAGSLFLFRTVLAGCLIGSVLLAALFTSHRVSALGKRIGLVLLLVGGLAFLLTTPFADNMAEYMEKSEKNLVSQMNNYVYRANGEANKLATYGSRNVFLPLMLMAPFPTLTYIADQPNAMMMGGAYFTRNVYAFFVIVALIALYKKRKLREHMLLLAFLFSYMFVLASSGFALSERFHVPLLPFLLILAAYGVSQMTQKNKKYFIPYLIFISLLVIGWNWFKIAGRA